VTNVIIDGSTQGRGSIESGAPYATALRMKRTADASGLGLLTLLRIKGASSPWHENIERVGWLAGSGGDQQDAGD